MRHFPAFCSDCRRLWLVGTAQAPTANPECPRCRDQGRLVPGAYYSDAGAATFEALEAAVCETRLQTNLLRELGNELERVLPSPLEPAIDAAFTVTMQRLSLEPSFGEKAVGKRVILRMLVTIVNSLSQPVMRESGVMRLPQTIPGLFDLVPKKRSSVAREAEASDGQAAQPEPDSDRRR